MEDKYYLINTYGCQMNIHESEKLAGMLEKLGYKATTDNKIADVVVFNTCAIRESAEQKIYGNIGDLKSIKKQHPNMIIAVCGCMSQQKGVAENIKKRYPFVDIVFGTHNLHMFEEYLISNLSSHKKIYDVWDKEQQIVENTPVYRTSNYNAWINIMYGCNNFCTYCIVPYVRGRERSRKMQDIINEATDMIQNKGYKTITLLGQNVNSYGNDIDDENVNFANLLTNLCKIDGDFRIKFLTSHPKDLTDKVIEVIAREPKISKTIHLPVQSGSTSVLKNMNRHYTAQDYRTLIDKIKKAIPDVNLTTDIIVGFPGESEEDFMQTYNLIKDVRYTSLFAFMYSKRRGTIAEKMENQIPLNIKHERINKILELERKISKEKTLELQGKVVEVLVCEQKNGSFIGKTDCGKTVQLIDNPKIKLGEFYNVKIGEIKANKLIGQVV